MSKRFGPIVLAAALAFSLAAGMAGPGVFPAAAAPISIDGGVDVTTAYFFRGVRQQDQGFIAQPFGNIGLEVYKTKDFTISAYGGIWNSFHDKKVPAGDDSHYYELDLLAGVNIAVGPVTVGVGYIFYNSPADAFKDIHEVELKVALDDSGIVKQTGFPFALNPYIKFNFEVQDDGGTEDTYWELGFEPSFEGKFGNVPVTLAIPVVFGLSADDYYLDRNGKNEAFGYFSIAGVATTPLPFPKNLGQWTLKMRVEYLYLDAFSLRAANDKRDPNEVIGVVGVAVAF